MGSAKRARVRQKVRKMRRERTAAIAEAIAAERSERNLFLEAIKPLRRDPNKPERLTPDDPDAR